MLINKTKNARSNGIKKVLNWTAGAMVATSILFSSGVFAEEGIEGETKAVAEQQVSETVNINLADAEAIADTLKGIGKSKAEAIVAYRTEHGQFESADELVQVKGIGEATVEKNKARIEI